MGRDSIVGSLREILQSWWTVDRVRASPSEGKLLRLRGGEIVEVDGQSVVILRRIEGERGLRPLVRYDCQTRHGDAELLIFIEDADDTATRSGEAWHSWRHPRVKVVWRHDGTSEVLDVEDVST